MTAQNKISEAIRLHQSGDFRGAATRYEMLLRENPQDANALHLLGVIAHQTGAHAKSIALIERAIKASPRHAAFHSNLGNAYFALSKTGEAVKCYEHAVRIDPTFCDALLNLGNALLKLNRPAEAEAAYSRIQQLAPENPDCLHGLGVARFRQGDVSNAMTMLSNVTKICPEVSAYQYSLALAFEINGNFGQASYHLRLAMDLAMRSGDTDAVARCRSALGMLLLRLGQFQEGFEEYEYRLQCPECSTYASTPCAPRWDGRETSKTLGVFAEQGFGDTLQFIRFATSARERVGHVIAVVPKQLEGILASVRGIDEVFSQQEIDGLEIDISIEMMSLPYMLGVSSSRDCYSEPYLFPDQDLVSRWEERLPKDAFRVGIVWQGAKDLNTDVWRSFPLQLLKPLSRLDKVHLISLQKGFGTDQLSDVDFPVTSYADLDTTNGAFADTAAIIENVDLVISCDSSVAHLAGAIGAPTWIVLPHVADWRWGLDSNASYWNSTSRLFRNDASNNWENTIQQVCESLANLANEQGRRA